jgi:hypothetical protein
MGLHQIKKPFSVHQKSAFTRVENQPLEWKKVFASVGHIAITKITVVHINRS